MNCVLSRLWRSSVYVPQFSRMSNPPPRKVSTSSSKTSKQDANPLRILLQMGFPKHRALKALAATGNRSVQLASDWLLTHVNDAYIDTEEAREYILYASPVGPLLAQLLEFWDKSKTKCGWNGAHNFPPHITLVSFFKAPDDTSVQLAKAVKHVVENVGDPPACPLKLEPYVSHNFMGLFVSEQHADYLKKIAVQYVKQVSSALGVSVDTYEQLNALGTCFPWCAMQQEKPIKSVNLEAHVKSLHITLAYHFEVGAFDELQSLVEELQPRDSPGWELRLYSRDPRFANHQVYKVIESYEAKASDELELVLGDYIYIEQKELDGSQDGWVHGTSWLTGVSGFLPAVYTRRTAESDAWTLHRAISLGNNNSSDCKSESDSATDGEMASHAHAHEDAHQLALDKSEEIYREWATYWQTVKTTADVSYIDLHHGSSSTHWGHKLISHAEQEGKTSSETNGTDAPRRWVFALRHGERVDLTYGQWTPHCFDQSGKYVRKDLNMPLKLGEREGGIESYAKDTPLTRVGRLQAFLVGEGLRLAGVSVRHVYASAALRCVETAHELLHGLGAGRDAGGGAGAVKVRVEPGLFEFKQWYAAKGLAPFMTPAELHRAGYNVDLDYKPYVDLDMKAPETLQEFYERNKKVMVSALSDTAAEGGNVIFVGHAATLDMMVVALSRLEEKEAEQPPYQISNNLLRVPYCALGAMRDNPYQVVAPPCPPSINSSSGRFDWRLLLDL